MLSSAIDHLVVTAPTLDSGVRFVEQLLGCTMQPGGRHARMGTHNALLKISETAYLEVISIDPAAKAPERQRWFELDSLFPHDRPRLATWAMRTNDIETVCSATDIELGVIESMSRGELEWRITIPPDGRLSLKGIAPAVIQWSNEPHPASKLAESSVALIQLSGTHPHARHIARLLAAANFDGPFSVAEPVAADSIGLTATFRTPGGLVVLS